jgi:hypothetical protein
LDDWEGLGSGRCAAISSSFLLLSAASYIHHDAVAMQATLKIILLIDCNEIWTIEKASGLLVLQLPTASCSRYEAVAMRATREKPLATLTANNYKQTNREPSLGSGCFQPASETPSRLSYPLPYSCHEMSHPVDSGLAKDIMELGNRLT